MIARRIGMIVSMLIVAAGGGCTSPGHTTAPASPGQVPAFGAVQDSSVRHTAKTFAIAFATFIPVNHLVAPSFHPQSYDGLLPPRRLVFAGDDRGFNVDASSYRAKQMVTVIPDESEDADGLLEGSKQNLGGITEAFDAQLALADGRIDNADRTSAATGKLDSRRKTIRVDTSGMVIEGPYRLGPHCVFVRLRTSFRGGPRNRLIVGSPSIDWDIGITIDTSGPDPVYEVSGKWDGYPAAELHINRQCIFAFTPDGNGGSCRDLLKLLPGLGDFDFVQRGHIEGDPSVIVQD
jgi:hypothetical protein